MVPYFPFISCRLYACFSTGSEYLLNTGMYSQRTSHVYVWMCKTVVFPNNCNLLCVYRRLSAYLSVRSFWPAAIYGTKTLISSHPAGNIHLRIYKLKSDGGGGNLAGMWTLISLKHVSCDWKFWNPCKYSPVLTNEHSPVSLCTWR